MITIECLQRIAKMFGCTVTLALLSEGYQYLLEMKSGQIIILPNLGEWSPRAAYYCLKECRNA